MGWPRTQPHFEPSWTEAGVDTAAAAISNERGAEHPQEPEPMWHQTQSRAAEQGGFICNDPRNGETHRGVGRGATSKNHGGTPTPRPGRGCRRPGALSASPPEAGVTSGGRRHLRVSAGEQDEGVAARGRPDAPQGPMLPLPEVPVMRDHRGDEQRCSAVVPARCLANRPNGHSGAGGASSVDAGRALCLAGAAVSSGASGGGRRSEGESFTEPGRGRGGGRGGPRTCPRLQQTPPPAAGRTEPSRRGPSCASPASSPACLGFTSRPRFHTRCTKTLKNSLCPARAGRSAPTRGSHRPKRFHGA